MSSIDALASALQIETGIHELTVWKWLAGGTVYPSINRELYAAQAKIKAAEAAALGAQTQSARCPHENGQ